MKKIKYLIIAFFTLITFNTVVGELAYKKKKTDYIKVVKANIDRQEIESIKKLTHTIITKIENANWRMEDGKYLKFSNENSENNIVDKIHYAPKNILQKRIKSKFGPLIHLHFESLYKSKTQNPFLNTIYRFKAEFKSTKKQIEIRLFLNHKKEIVDLHVKSWKKELFN